jgi:hypothetical protein
MSFRINQEWEEAACDILNAIPTKFLNGQDLTGLENAIVGMVVNLIGPPPEAPDGMKDIPHLVIEFPPNSPIIGNSGTH